MSIHTLVGLVSRCVRLCRENREQTPARAVRTDLGRFPGADGGRKLRQDKEQASSATLCSVTSARSAGSYGGFQSVPKWGQNRKGDITSAVAFPESILPQEKSGGHAPEKMLSWAKRYLPLCRTPERKIPFCRRTRSRIASQNKE